MVEQLADLPQQHVVDRSATDKRVFPVDRRRPGRPTHVAPELVGLLRFRPPLLPVEVRGSSDLATAGGVMLSSVLGAGIWLASAWLAGLLG